MKWGSNLKEVSAEFALCRPSHVIPGKWSPGKSFTETWLIVMQKERERVRTRQSSSAQGIDVHSTLRWMEQKGLHKIWTLIWEREPPEENLKQVQDIINVHSAHKREHGWQINSFLQGHPFLPNGKHLSGYWTSHEVSCSSQTPPLPHRTKWLAMKIPRWHSIRFIHACVYKCASTASCSTPPNRGQRHPVTK